MNDTRSLKDTLLNFIVPIVSMLVTLLLFVFVIYPSINLLPTLKAEKAKTETLKNQLDTKLVVLNKLVDFKSVVDENVDLASKVMTSEPLIPELLTQIDTIARESGLEISRLSYSFADTGQALSTEAVATDYQTVLVSLGVRGNYAQMVSFLNSLENAARLVNVNDFRYTEEIEEGGNTLGLSFSLSAPYIFVQSTAVTDEPINVDITDPKFIGFMDKLKNLKFYTPSVNLNLPIVNETTPTPDVSDAVNENTVENITGENVTSN